jgi:2-polyprenyl-6-methoxyphenol hydroxylase-like FAD-dependent oxidoreductase
MTITVPVLVAGGGPVGLMTAYDLQSRGVQVLLVERNPATTQHPKMDITNGRSLEHFRRLGIAEGIRNVAVPRDHPMDVAWVTRLNEWELARFRYPDVNTAREWVRQSNDGTQSLEPNMRLSQVHLEPEFVRILKECPRVELRFGWALTGFTQDAAGVSATIVEMTSGRTEQVHCQLLAGCDGGGSLVREHLGFRCHGRHNVGRFYMVHFRSTHRELLQKFGIAWHYQSPISGTLIAQDDDQIWTLHEPIALESEQSIDPVQLVYRSLGVEFPLEVLQANAWSPHLVAADGYGRGRVWMAGDAVHQFIPTGGYGMNSGICDAADLAWKFAAVLQGWGGPRLLESIDAERRPVASENRDASERHMGVRLRISEQYDPVIHESSAAGGAARSRIAQTILDYGNAENEALGIEIGYRYRQSPVICHEPNEPRWDLRAYIPSTWPGVRAPHVFLEDGTAIFDLFAQGFTLLRFGDADTSSLERAALERGVPLRTVDIRDRRAMELYERRLVLIRPDQHVAWRSDGAPSDSLAVIDRVRGA